MFGTSPKKTTFLIDFLLMIVGILLVVKIWKLDFAVSVPNMRIFILILMYVILQIIRRQLKFEIQWVSYLYYLPLLALIGLKFLANKENVNLWSDAIHYLSLLFVIAPILHALLLFRSTKFNQIS